MREEHNKSVIEKSESAKTAVRSVIKLDKHKVAEALKGESKRNPKGANPKSTNSKVSSDKLELLITVVNRQKSDFYQDLLQSFDVNMQLVIRARGTATAQTLHLLGLEDTPKSVIFSIIREDKLQDALATLKTKFHTIKDGAGVAYTVPLTSVIGVAIFGFLSNNKKTVKEVKNEKV